MRALLKPFAVHAAYSPIETIVFFSIVGTLAYFHVLSAIKHSAFFAPSHPTTLRPAHALLRQDEWLPAREHTWNHASLTAEDFITPLEIQQIIFSLDSVHKPRDVVPESITMDMPPLAESVFNITQYFTGSLQSPTGRKYTSICHRPSVNRSVIGSHPHLLPCFTEQTTSPRTFTETLTFTPGTRDDFMASITRVKSTSDLSGVRFDLDTQVETIGQMKSGKWVAYALGTLVLRFWDLTKRADSLDIMLILLGYILMHLTFALLFLRSRKLGSNFWLPLAILSSSVLALLLSLPVAMWFRIPMDPVALTEALPFLVCTVGFDKPFQLARTVFRHPHLTSPVGGASSGGQLKPAGEIILESLTAVYYPILRDYILEIAVLTLGANSKVGGLREVCALAALILAVDCLMLCTFLSSILCVMIEVRRIKNVRAMSRSRSSSVVSGRPTKPTNLGQRVSTTLLGVKGSSLSVPGKKTDQKQESPVVRLKLLLIASFLIMHILNVSTPLMRTRHSTHITGVRKVDITSPTIRTLLHTLSETEKVDSETLLSDEQQHELVVKVHPPVHIRVVPPPALLVSAIQTPRASSRSTSELLENFMSSWTRLVGDPVLSKWIVMVLAISISLNGYLLRAIASGMAGRGATTKSGGVRFRSVERSVREVEEDQEEEILAKVNVRQQQPPEVVMSSPAIVIPSPPPPPVVPVALPVVPTFSLDDVDRRLKATKRLTITHPTSDASMLSSASSEGSFEGDHQNTEHVRSLEECIDVFDNGPRPLSMSLSLLNDEEVVLLAQNGKIAAYALEKVLGPTELERAVRIRRALISRASRTQTLESSDVPMTNYDYSRVLGACCENVVGYIPVPLGIAGPLRVDGVLIPIPMATAEGTLVASTSRGCKALNAGGGVITVLTQDAMTRGPAIDFPSIVLAAQAKAWIASPDGYGILKEAFESTSRFAKLSSLKTAMAGRTLFVRFATATGDAMGMNMISKGTEKALEVMQKRFPDMVVLALSGNYCTDKKPAAINWIEGRGKSVVAEAVIPGKVVKSVLKTTVAALCNLNTKKNLVGSAMAGSIGGFNAHAANILTAVFLATGQDPAQNVESSNCMTLMEPTNDGEDLLMTVSMPSIEVGTVGGGTVLAPQQAVLEMLGIKGAHPTHPGQNSQALARLIAAAVMAGELSLISALAAGHLVRAHLVHNRSQPSTPAISRPATPGPMIMPIAGQLAPKSGLPLGPLTPSSSTASLPPYSRHNQV